MSFLAVLVTTDGDQFWTSFFLNITAIGLFTNYLRFKPLSYTF